MAKLAGLPQGEALLLLPLLLRINQITAPLIPLCSCRWVRSSL
jgi:hypothetical protein